MWETGGSVASGPAPKLQRKEEDGFQNMMVKGRQEVQLGSVGGTILHGERICAGT